VAIPDNLLRGKGCPSCAQHGFNPDKPAYFYTIHFYVDESVGGYIGFGTTKDIDTRMSYHRLAIERAGYKYDLKDLYIFDSGHDARALEDIVKENMTIIDSGVRGFRKEAVSADDYIEMLELLEAVKICV